MCIWIPEESLSDKSTTQRGTSGVVELDQNPKHPPFHAFVGRAHSHKQRGRNLVGCTDISKQLQVHVQPGRMEFIDRPRHHLCYNTKTKLKSRGNGGKRHSSSDHNPFAKWKTLRAWEGREGRWTESTDDGPASETDGTCVIMGDRRLSPPWAPPFRFPIPFQWVGVSHDW